MKAASCFSGIGGAEAAYPEADWLWCAEIEPAPCDILATRFPHSANLGDITARDFIQRAQAHGRLDLLCGGPPCQAFSVAGLRKGMNDPRGQLSISFVEILHAIRPLNALVENVPGWLNHPDNAFGCFLGAVVGADDALPAPQGGSWPREGMVEGPRARVAWRVLDAQYFGLAQRRERVFAVIDFGEGADPAAVLFERQSGIGDPAARRKAGESVTGTLSARTQGGGGLGTDFDCDGGIVAACRMTAIGEYADDDTASTLKARDFKDATDLIAHTLRGEGSDASEDGTGRGTPLVPVAFSSKDYGNDATLDLSPTLRSMNNVDSPPNGGGQMAVAFAQNTRDEVRLVGGDGSPVGALAANPGMKQTSYIADGWAVRRLTPAECEILQGFPVGHTLIETGKRRTVDADEAAYLTAHGAHVVLDNEGRHRTNAMADGPRYKALGNAWAVNCARWIIQRIAEGQRSKANG